MNPRGSPWQCLDMPGSIRPHQWHFFARKREQKINWIELQNPHVSIQYMWKNLCIHWLLSVVPPHKAYIFRFNTPHFEGLTPLVPIRFWQKVRGWPPWSPYIWKNVGSTPLLLNHLGWGIIVHKCHNYSISTSFPRGPYTIVAQDGRSGHLGQPIHRDLCICSSSRPAGFAHCCWSFLFSQLCHAGGDWKSLLKFLFEDRGSCDSSRRQIDGKAGLHAWWFVDAGLPWVFDGIVHTYWVAYPPQSAWCLHGSVCVDIIYDDLCEAHSFKIINRPVPNQLSVGAATVQDHTWWCLSSLTFQVPKRERKPSEQNSDVEEESSIDLSQAPANEGQCQGWRKQGGSKYLRYFHVLSSI